MTKKQESNGLGIASMIIGIMGIFGSWIPFLGAPVAALGLVLGLVQKNWTTNGLAITGVSLNGIWIGIQAFWITMFFIGLFVGA